VVVESSWLEQDGAAARKLAETIYEHREFDRMPRLGVALEAAGCRDAELLAHCEGNGAHVRGCWLIDLLLDK
jgi:hypothetical protein